jgi:hypothetical protein
MKICRMTTGFSSGRRATRSTRHPQRSDTEPRVDGELVEQGALDDDLDGEVRRPVGLLRTQRVTLVRFEPSLACLTTERGAAESPEVDVVLLGPHLEQPAEDGLRLLVELGGAHELERALEERHPHARVIDRVAERDIGRPRDAAEKEPLLGARVLRRRRRSLGRRGRHRGKHSIRVARAARVPEREPRGVAGLRARGLSGTDCGVSRDTHPCG